MSTITTPLNILVTGGNRGIGLELVKQLSENSSVAKVFSSSRDKSYYEIVDLQKQFPNKIVIVEMDITNEASVSSAVNQIELELNGQTLDILINNAGIAEPAPYKIEDMDRESLLKQFDNNTCGTHIVTKSFLPLLRKSNVKKVINVSSMVGSMKMTDGTFSYSIPAYSISKAAINMLTRQYALSLKDELFIFISMCPGYVKTRLSPYSTLLPEESVKGILQTVFNSTIKDNGSYISYNGDIIPW